MGSVSDDLSMLVEETLGCNLIGMQVRHEDNLIVNMGKQDSSAQLLEIHGTSFVASFYIDTQRKPNEKEVNHILKILNIYTEMHVDTPSRIFSGGAILETITNRKSIDDVLKQLISVLVGRGGFCRAGIMFLNEALLELRGVIFEDRDKKFTSSDFRKCSLTFETKNQLSDIMFYDRTDVVKMNSSDELDFIKKYFCCDVLVTGLGGSEKPIGILLACKDNYSDNDKDAVTLYGNICSLAIEFSRTAKQLELTMADLNSLRKTTINSENLVQMGRLSATVAHELKNPLVAIGGFTHRMEQTAVNPQTKNYIKIVQAEVHRLERIVGDILTYSRKIELQIEDIVLNDFINEVMEVIKNCLCFNMINMIVKVEKNLIINADKDRMKQVIINLISNSVQEMPDGGDLRIEASESGRHITISVSDTGCGIPVDKREKIFEPFYTLKKTGTGLGLPLCKKIMTAHGGDIVVGDSAKGTVFTLILPKRG